LLCLDKEAFQSVLRTSPEATLAILDTVTERLQNTESMLRHHEKLSALGTLAAGLAHEINNPSAAIQRSAEQLKELLPELSKASEKLTNVFQGDEKRRHLERLRDRLAEAQPMTLDGLEQSDREAKLEAWLESVGVDEAWRFVTPLVTTGWTTAELVPLQGELTSDDWFTVICWLAYASDARELVAEVAQASERISSIVESVKDFTYLDQAPEQVVDIHKGIEDTLVILRHKIGDGILIKKEFASDLPRVEGFGSELTQVWTNLIENAVDAMNGEGTLTLKTLNQPDGVQVCVCDDGPGIPEGEQQRIFEPFYTTKAPGVGTGLGLHLVYNVVVQRHNGSVELESEPGRTCFMVTLPTTS
jgi:signal transduction histidine kinase